MSMQDDLDQALQQARQFALGDDPTSGVLKPEERLLLVEAELRGRSRFRPSSCPRARRGGGESGWQRQRPFFLTALESRRGVCPGPSTRVATIAVRTTAGTALGLRPAMPGPGVLPGGDGGLACP
jgi:hypothetical protein